MSPWISSRSNMGDIITILCNLANWNFLVYFTILGRGSRNLLPEEIWWLGLVPPIRRIRTKGTFLGYKRQKAYLQEICHTLYMQRIKNLLQASWKQKTLTFILAAASTASLASLNNASFMVWIFDVVGKGIPCFKSKYRVVQFYKCQLFIIWYPIK